MNEMRNEKSNLKKALAVYGTCLLMAVEGGQIGKADRSNDRAAENVYCRRFGSSAQFVCSGQVYKEEEVLLLGFHGALCLFSSMQRVVFWAS